MSLSALAPSVSAVESNRTQNIQESSASRSPGACRQALTRISGFFRSLVTRTNPLPTTGEEPLFPQHLLPTVQENGSLMYPEETPADVAAMVKRAQNYVKAAYRWGHIDKAERAVALRRIELAGQSSLIALDPNSHNDRSSQPEVLYFLPRHFKEVFGASERFRSRMSAAVAREYPSDTPERRLQIVEERLRQGHAYVELDDVLDLVDPDWHPLETHARRSRFHPVIRPWRGVALVVGSFVLITATQAFFLGTFQQMMEIGATKEKRAILADMELARYRVGRDQPHANPLIRESLQDFFDQRHGSLRWMEMESVDEVVAISNFLTTIQLALADAKRLENNDILKGWLTQLYDIEVALESNLLDHPMGQNFKTIIAGLWATYDPKGLMKEALRESFPSRIKVP